MPIHTEKNYKLYYSIAEVAEMFDVNQSLLRFWEKEFPQTLSGARQKFKDNKQATILNFEIINRLKEIREELLSIKKELDER